MAGVRRKGTDNNRLLLWPSGREDGIRKDAILFPLFPLSVCASRSWLDDMSECVRTSWRTFKVHMSVLGHVQNLCVFPSHAHMATWLCIALRCMYVLACKLCFVYIFINLFIAAPVLKHICLLCLTRLNVLLGVFPCFVDPKRVRLTRVSLISIFTIESGISAWGQILVCGGQGTYVCVCVFVRERETKWLMIDSRQTCKQTNKPKEWQVDRRTT